ncbi:FAD-binding oxidoreductase [Actinomadura decatromicini]|uniref:FAD-binding oxidoreductase n=1 Tax=Actinomadura decatromicini TaxID=2604572 RepID=A0A5D3F7N6_9ACTN|nr:FAD-binding oxidoreductase [Actinomadura decatromicini]TYK44079.1 FAD-binding oxidoreductase [Actinomadura decatromicini]
MNESHGQQILDGGEAVDGDTTPSAPPIPSGGTITVTPGNPRFKELTVGNNQRWVAAPESVQIAGDADDVLRIVQKAVRGGKRVSVRGGGHCYADFVYSTSTEVIIDTSAMNRIYWDPAQNAFAVEPGAELGRVYEVLYRRWGVTVPGGVCPFVGIAGHATGGGYGLLSRKFGVVADHIAAVEMVVVNSLGHARLVTASRRPSDPNHDLWWAVCGGGGGNFGVITKYWFRSADAAGTSPREALPNPPSQVIVSAGFIPYARLPQDAFRTLIANFGAWQTANASPASPYTSLSGIVFVPHRAAGGLGLVTQIDATVPGATTLLDDYLTALVRGTGIQTPTLPHRTLNWLASTRYIGTSQPALMTDPSERSAVKSAYMRQPFTPRQIDAIYENVMRTDYANMSATVQLTGVAGGKVNAVAPDATAYSHRNATYLALFENFWVPESEDAQHIGWLRDIFGQVFADTGGYPTPGAQADGCYINSPDPDILDPAYNKSGVPWSTLYYGGNYPRLQRVKAKWDPTDFFRHSQSIALPR